MKTLNLVNAAASEVKYELTVFPDGEPHIKLEEIDRKDTYKVICRISNPNDLFILAQVGNILQRQSVIFDVVITYLMSMRMDRVINFNEAFSLEVVANIINSFNANKIAIFECHSERAFSLIKNSYPIDMLDYLKVNGEFYEIFDSDENAICFPDHGAQDRYSSSFKLCKCDRITMKKVRDLENKGAIKSMEIENLDEVNGKDYKKITIVDDLCDAGGTFCWAASILREKFPNAKLGIFVKHLVNKVGLEKLTACFDEVYFTNSYKDWNTDYEKLISDNDDHKAKVKIFNIV